jgi:hypothetical protein
MMALLALEKLLAVAFEGVAVFLLAHASSFAVTWQTPTFPPWHDTTQRGCGTSPSWSISGVIGALLVVANSVENAFSKVG